LINNNLRFLVSNNQTEGKNESNNKTNANHSEQGLNENKGKSGIGWLGISLIILLSLIVIYVIYVGFRYFCTDRQTAEGATDGIEIIHKGNDVWVDALGRVIS
jgi:hypothetical protein